MRLHTKVYLKVYLGLGGLSSRLAGCFVLMALVFCAGRASGQVTGRQLKPQELSPESTTMIPLEQVLGEVAAARKAIAEHRDSAEAYLRLAMALRSAGELQGALDAVNQALSLDPRLSRAWLQKGLMTEDDGNLRAATDDFQRA